MFPINYRNEDSKYHYIELLVHGDLTIYRKQKAQENSNMESFWEVQKSSGEWEEESILDDIVEELFQSKELGYFTKP